MWGIVGYIGKRDAAPLILESLRKLEYRGYDSAGIAVVNDGHVMVRRCEGKPGNLETLLDRDPMIGTIGIGHTRWATHGRPSESNAHPHRAGKISVAHNGIIENYLELRRELSHDGRRFGSETDSEIVSHLIDQEISKGHSTLKALQNSLKKIRGSYALTVMNEDENGVFYAARFQSPLVVGLGEKENFVASDVPALLPHTRRVIFLEDGDVAEIRREGI